MQNQSVPGFLQAHAVLISVKNFKMHYFDAGQSVWAITEEHFRTLLGVFEKEHDHCLVSKVNNKQFITSYRGLIFVDDSIGEKDTIAFDGIKVLKLEIPRVKWFSSTSIYQKNLVGWSTEELLTMEENRKEKERVENEKLEKYKNKIKELRKNYESRFPGNEEYMRLVKSAFNFDHSYNYSDDSKVWRAGENRRDELIKAFNGFGLDGVKAMNEIINAHVCG